MTSGFMAQLLLDAARALGQAGEYPKEAVFSSEGSLDDRAKISTLLLPDKIDFDNLSDNLSLTRHDIVGLNQKFSSLLWQCWRSQVLFCDIRGTGVRLAANLSGGQRDLLQYIAKRFRFSYDTEELSNGKGIMLLILDLIDLLEADIDTPASLYLNFQWGRMNGSSPLIPSFREACLAVESELNPSIRQIQQLSMNIWRLARHEEVVVNDGLLVIKINLHAELSPELEALCQRLIELLAANDWSSESNELPDGSSGPPEIEGVPESPDPATEEIHD